MKKPSLWRYYGLNVLLFSALLVDVLVGTIGRICHLEWLIKWGFERFGALWLGLCFLIRGLDFLLLFRRYPPFLKENAPQWDTTAHRSSPAKLLYTGAVATLGGLLGVSTGVWNLLDAMGLI